MFLVTPVPIRAAEDNNSKTLLEKFHVKTDRRGCGPRRSGNRRAAGGTYPSCLPAQRAFW
jgi:hypothetical protein